MVAKDTGNDYDTWIYFQDEVNAFRTGWRKMTVREGDKWAWLTDSAGRRARITLDLLDQLMKTERHIA